MKHSTSTMSMFFDKQEAQQSKCNVLILDGHNMIFRNLFMAHFIAATEEERRTKETYTMSGADAIDFWKYLMINSLFNCIRMFKPNVVVFALDAKNSWRKKVYKEYKANRKGARDSSAVDFDAFFPVMEKFFEDLRKAMSNVYIVEVDESEADDVTAVLTRDVFCDTSKYFVTIITTDKDDRQLLQYSNVRIYDPIKRKFVECINPKRELELSFITGDKIDNIPAVRLRVGKATAAKILDSGMDVMLQDPTMSEAYKRNRVLIDFDCIPTKIVNRIKKSISTYKCVGCNFTDLYMFMVKNKIRRFVADLQDFVPYLQKVGSL
jgi:5'-3' exonuclease